MLEPVIVVIKLINREIKDVEIATTMIKNKNR